MDALITVLVLFAILGCAIWLVDMIPMPPQLKIVARVILGLIGLVWRLRSFGLLTGHHVAGPP